MSQMPYKSSCDYAVQSQLCHVIDLFKSQLAERINSILSSMWSEEQTATVLRCLVPEELLSNCMMISQYELNNAANSNSDERNHTQISILILFIT